MKIKRYEIVILCYATVWWLLPHIQIANYYPLQTTTARIFTLVLGSLIWRWRSVYRFIGEYKNHIDLKNQIKQYCLRYYIKRMPIYFVQGDHTSIDLGSDQIAQRWQKRLQHKFPNSKFLFKQRAMLIQRACRDVCHYIKKTRINQPINGLIVIRDISQASDPEIIEQHISHLFDHHLPKYTIYTHLQKLIGFDEFFADISYEESQQHWGMQINNDFEMCYTRMLSALHTRSITMIEQTNSLQQRQLIINFPQQLSLLKSYIAAHLSQNQRAIYFCAEPNYFYFRIFEQAILSEATSVGYSPHYFKVQHYKPYFYYIGAPLSIVMVGLAMQLTLGQTKRLDTMTQRTISHYRQAQVRIDPSSRNISKPLVALGVLEQNLRQLNHRSWLSYLALPLLSVNRANQHAIQRAMTRLFTLRVAAILEQQLRNLDRNDINALYANLKAYLAFSATSSTNSKAIIAPALFYWQHQHLEQQTYFRIQQTLLKVSNQSLIKLPLDHRLIQQLKQRLLKIDPLQRVFALLHYKANTSNLPVQRLDPLLQSAIKPQQLYTRYGYHNIVKKYLRTIARQVSRDNQQINLGEKQTYTAEAIYHFVWLRYQHNYINYWQKRLESLNLTSCDTLSTCLQLGTQLSQQQGSLVSLLTMISDNTDSLAPHESTIHDYFSQYQQYRQQNLSKLLSDIQQVNQLLSQALSSTDPSHYLFIQAQALYQDQLESLQAITDDSRNAPPAVARVTQQYVRLIKQLILQSTSNYINKKWRQLVLTYYDQNLKNLYPFDSRASLQCPLDNFDTFFKKSGIWMSFFKHYLKTFTPYNKLTKQLLLINDEFFSNDAIHAKFSLKPELLSANSKSIIIQLGDKQLEYRHGPMETARLSWPTDQGDSSCHVIINGFSDGGAVISFSGPWALFQCLQAGSIQPLDNNLYRLTFSSQHYHADYLLSSNLSESAVTLKALQQLMLTQNIIQLTLRRHDEIITN